MAFRIHDSVVRGEVDNRVKGMVRGKVWVEGRQEPVVLELTGNAHPDLAGCLLKFSNPLPRVPHQHLDGLDCRQRGSIGDLTASRKVRVFDIPLEEALSMIRRKEKPPEHMANSLYLEWFSEANGRVVIESADYTLEISAPEWRMTTEDEAERGRQAAAGMSDFMGKLTEAIEQHERSHKDHEEEWDEHDYEKFMKECDARTDKYMELLDKYGDSDEAEAKIDKEMGWGQNEDEQDDDRMSVEEINAICAEAADAPEPEPDPAREGIDWIRDEYGYVHHPLQHRCSMSACKFYQRTKDLGHDKLSDDDLDKFLSGFQIAGAKLAGALSGIARGECHFEPAMMVAYLKRALDFLHQAVAGLEAVATKKLLPAPMITEARQEIFDIREGILGLMDEFRGRK